MEMQNIKSSEILDLISNKNDVSHHHIIIEKAIKVAQEIKGVRAILLAGSLAIDSGDVFSDIDFKVAFDPDITDGNADAGTFLEKADLVAPVIIHYQSTANSVDRIIYYRPFIKFELNIRTAEVLSNGPKNARCKILFETDDAGKKIIREASKQKFTITDHRDFVQNISTAFPNLCYITMGYVLRGELITAFSDLNWQREMLLEINGYLLGQENEGPRRAEQRFPQYVQDYYMASYSDDKNHIREALLVQLRWYSELLIPLLEKNGFQTGKELANTIADVINESL
ncbi:MAG: aminoglycoside 6-adenylyltransferase [Spirochaetales bacterium]|nr:aminoglycoside 6-adenylyltransferase [Spirochaetales bacterium]